MKLNVGEIRGLLANSYNITVPSDSAISFATGAQLTHSTLSTSHMVVPYGTTVEWDNQVRVHQKDFLNGQIRWNTTDQQLQVYYNGWMNLVTGISVGDIGSQQNPAVDGNAIMRAGKSSGIYWIQPEGQTAYQMYVNNDDNGGGWVLCVHARTSTCQDHMTNSAVNISGTTGPRTNNTSTTKMADSWIQALRNGSSYTGTTAYWMHALDFGPKNVFISSIATVDLLSSASNDNPRTRISTTYQGSLSDRGPNSGTRGFGDHHTSGGTYFAYGRHPESGNNCGFREDSNGASNGYLWVK